MSSRRLLVSTATNDAISDQDIREVETASILNMWASAVTVTDLIGLRLFKTIIMDDGTANVRAAALGLVNTEADQLLFDSLVGIGNLRLPVPTLTTSLIFILSVEPIVQA